MSILFVSCKEDTECCPATLPAEDSATYSVTLTFNWNKTDFPTDYPSGPHFSPLVGWVHQDNNDFFDEGKTATVGIKNMAELGATSKLIAELDAEINNGKGLKSYVGSGLNNGVGTISINVEVSTKFPSVSFVTMLAPSPDWFIACLDVNLLNANHDFIEEKTVIGQAYDAGTDSGATFTSSNSETNPKEVIAEILQPPLGDGKTVKASLCSITFKKQ